MDLIFSFLFRYRPFFFWEGDFGFRWSFPFWLYLVGLALILGSTFLLYRKQIQADRRSWWLWGLRSSLLILLAAIFLGPTLTMRTMVPEEGLLAVLVDNSKSMSIREGGLQEARGEPLLSRLGPDSEFAGDLDENFQTRWLKFSDRAERLRSVEQLDWSGEQTNLQAAFERVLSETENLPLAGIVLISDGADNSFRDTRPVLEELRSRQIPIHTVGLGRESMSQDVEIREIDVPGRVLPDSVAVARVRIQHPGYRGSRAQLVVREGNSLVASEEVHFSPDSDVTTAEVQLLPRSTGVKNYDFVVDPLEGEEISENNSRRSIVEVRPDTPRVLLVEGRPRWEYKFLRQALSGDKFLRLEALLRTALNKFYRQGIERETTLATGFPATREELFEYEGLILGDLESAFFSYAQMELIRDFVSRRGGGLLMLGGGSTLSAGGYENTPIEEILPVSLGAPGASLDRLGGYVRTSTEIVLTDYGKNHPALQLASEGPDEVWDELPSMADRNLVGDLKPGATVLAQSRAEGVPDSDEPLLVSQRFGRGLGLVFLTGSTWRWQMLRDHSDQSHERFWRQILRWLIRHAQARVSAEVEREVYSQNELVNLRVEVNDSAFNGVNDARIEASVVEPDGSEQPLELQWIPREDGVYEGSWAPRKDGLHRIRVSARASSGEETYGEGQAQFLTLTGQSEFFNSTQKRTFLETMAADTGGRYYTLDSVQNLPEEIMYTESQASVIEVLDLWNLPFNFFLLLSLLFGEWLVRRRMGMI